MSIVGRQRRKRRAVGGNFHLATERQLRQHASPAEHIGSQATAGRSTQHHQRDHAGHATAESGDRITVQHVRHLVRNHHREGIFIRHLLEQTTIEDQIATNRRISVEHRLLVVVHLKLHGRW